MIKCRLSNIQTQPSKLETNTVGTQKKPYIGGSGWKRTTYSYFDTSNAKQMKEKIDSGNYENNLNEEGILL